MATPIPTQCLSSCHDSQLSVLANNLSIITFFYAISAGFYLYTYIFAHDVNQNPRELSKFVQSLNTNNDEIRAATSAYKDMSNSTADEYVQHLERNIVEAAENAIITLRALIKICEPLVTVSQDVSSQVRFFKYRGRFFLLHKALKEGTTEKNLALERFRRAEERLMSQLEED